jgi:hypothetical protein
MPHESDSSRANPHNAVEKKELDVAEKADPASPYRVIKMRVAERARRSTALIHH